MAKKLYNYSALKGRIVEKFGSQKDFATYIKWHNGRVSNVLNSKSGLSRDDIDLWCEALEIDVSDIGTFFFMPFNLTNVR